MNGNSNGGFLPGIIILLTQCYGSPCYICNIVLQHFYCNMVDAIRTTPEETLFGSLLLFLLWFLALVLYVCMYVPGMYVCRVITYSKSMDQPGKVANPAGGQLNRGNKYFPVRVRA